MLFRVFYLLIFLKHLELILMTVLINYKIFLNQYILSERTSFSVTVPGCLSENEKMRKNLIKQSCSSS